MDDTRVFKDKQREALFWDEINQVIDRYPEVLVGMDCCYSYEDDDSEDRLNRGRDYDPNSPKYISGMAILLNVVNLDRDEANCTLTPPTQPRIVTRGLLCGSH
jgi:hypothetical protein